MLTNWYFDHIMSYVSQTKIFVGLLIANLEEANEGVEFVLKLQLIENRLSQILSHLVDSSRKNIDEETASKISNQGFIEWSNVVDDTLLLIDSLLHAVSVITTEKINTPIKLLEGVAKIRNSHNS